MQLQKYIQIKQRKKCHLSQYMEADFKHTNYICFKCNNERHIAKDCKNDTVLEPKCTDYKGEHKTGCKECQKKKTEMKKVHESVQSVETKNKERSTQKQIIKTQEQLEEMKKIIRQNQQIISQIIEFHCI